MCCSRGVKRAKFLAQGINLLFLLPLRHWGSREGGGFQQCTKLGRQTRPQSNMLHFVWGNVAKWPIIWCRCPSSLTWFHHLCVPNDHKHRWRPFWQDFGPWLSSFDSHSGNSRNGPFLRPLGDVLIALLMKPLPKRATLGLRPEGQTTVLKQEKFLQ